jgi:hypothetical protein
MISTSDTQTHNPSKLFNEKSLEELAAGFKSSVDYFCRAQSMNPRPWSPPKRTHIH